MPLYLLLDYGAELVRVDGIEFYGNVAEAFRSAIGLFRRSRRQFPCSNLPRSYREPLEMDIGVRCELPQRLLNLMIGVDARRVEVAKMIDVDRSIFELHIFGGLTQKRQARVALRHHERHVILGCYWRNHARERVFFKPNFDVAIGAGPQGLSIKPGGFPKRLLDAVESAGLALPAAKIDD